MLSVIIPTRDRLQRLTRTLLALERQQRPADGFEVVIVDNGSRDGTLRRMQDRAANFPVALRAVQEPSPGPAAARNRGVQEATGDVLLFLGDDTRPARTDLIARHAALHARGDSRYGVLGRVEWDPSEPITELMRWLEQSGKQFEFQSLRAGRVSVADHFYSSHVSLTRAAFERAGGFDPRFPHAAVEDTEFGVRLGETGAELEYRPELVVFHHHPMSLAQSLERHRRVGHSARLYNELRPDRDHRGIRPPSGLRWALLRRTSSRLSPLTRRRLPRAIRTRAWLALHMASYHEGYSAGVAAARDRAPEGL